VYRLAHGKEIDYFTAYGLGEVANSFKHLGPHHQRIHYDRSHVANRIYTMIYNKKGLVAMEFTFYEFRVLYFTGFDSYTDG